MADPKPSTSTTAAALTLEDECFVVMGRDVIDIFDLECSVCKDLFDMVKKPPKLLPCKHTLCGPCLEALKENEPSEQGISRTSNVSVDCPFCTETFSSATRLQNDHRVVKGLEIVKKSKAAFKNVCLKHNCKSLNRFCETCEVPVCSDCLKFLHDDEDDDHNIVDLTTAMKKMADPLNDLERRCLTSIQQMKMRNEIIKCVKNRLAENEADAISKIEKQFDHYSKLMSARKDSLIAMTKDKTRARVSEINLESQKLDSSTATLQKLFNGLTISRESDAVREIFKLRKQIIDQQDLLKVPSNEGLSKTFEFKAVNGGRLEEDIATVGDLQEKMDLKLECPTTSSFQASQGRTAVCRLQPDPSSTQNVAGVISFSQASENDYISITVQISGLDAVKAGSDDAKFQHGFHVHEYGDVTGGCKTTGGHYNPYSTNHGAPTSTNRHVGDFGNLRQDASGVISTTFTDTRASLFGTNSIIGRAIVLHAGTDDLGLGGDASSLANGNAGSRLGCCVIGWAKN